MDNNAFQGVLHEFAETPEFEKLGAGRFQRAEKVREFERRYSKLQVHDLHGDGPKKSARVYIKIYKNVYKKSPEKLRLLIEREYDSNLFWADNLEAYEEFSAIRPLFQSVPRRAIITKAEIGKNLGDLVRRRLRYTRSREKHESLQRHMFNVGRLLKIMQECEASEKRFDFSELVEDVDLRMRILVDEPTANFGENLRRNVLNFYEKNIPKIEQNPLPICYLHRDFMMANVLVNRSKTIIHDFTKMDEGSRMFDLTRFYHHLGLLKYKPTYPRAAVSRLQESFLRGYDYESGVGDTLFNFFLLRHYMTHFKGLVRDSRNSVKARLYNKWVMKNHVENIQRIVL